MDFCKFITILLLFYFGSCRFHFLPVFLPEQCFSLNNHFTWSRWEWVKDLEKRSIPLNILMPSDLCPYKSDLCKTKTEFGWMQPCPGMWRRLQEAGRSKGQIFSYSSWRDWVTLPTLWFWLFWWKWLGFLEKQKANFLSFSLSLKSWSLW